MIKMKRLTEEKMATPVNDIELCGKQDCLGNCYKDKKAEQQKEVDDLLKVKRDSKEVVPDIEPTQKPIIESFEVKDRKELAELLTKLKNEGKKYKIGRSTNEGYRYTVKAKLIEACKLKEEDDLPEVQPEEPIVVPTEDEVGKEEVIKEATKFTLISTLIADLWKAVDSYKSTLTTLQLEEVPDLEVEEILNNMVDEALVNIGLLNKMIGVEEEHKEEVVEESLQEGFNNKEQMEFLDLCNKLGIKTGSDLVKFSKEHNDVKDQELLQAMRDSLKKGLK